ncbi:PREDICTED: uncharacterized protein LOC104826994 [Tarenaya hassleriana]|uniref:uncharacterized protein LOC104826994 n=1 Tax=Tarenaya hassleriana TaxID=28532 RepID=UPI00053C677C|nr:PREDICTED: uncharacterized protein LOC104826994 [Tarenaya hassleriana]
MSLLRSAIRTNLGLRLPDPIPVRPSLTCLNEWRKSFSTETEQPPEKPPVDGFFRSSGTGPVYGKLLGFSKRTLKTDILHLLDGCNLTPDDIKFSYSRGGAFALLGTYVRFPSRSSYDNALRSIMKKGKLYKIERAERAQWDPLPSYEGKVVVLHGIPLNALVDDIERFLSGCDYHPSFQFVRRGGMPDPVRVAVVHFPSQTHAMNAFFTKNRGFCLNNQVMMQVLQ